MARGLGRDRSDYSQPVSCTVNTAQRAWLASLPLSPRAQVVFVFDLAAAALCWLLAFALRFNFEVPQDYLALALGSLVWVVPLHAVVFVLAGLYRGLWRFASLNDLRRLAVAGVAAGAGIALIAYLKQAELPIPRSVVVLAPLLLVLMMGGARAAYRSWIDLRLNNGAPDRRPLIIIGAGEAAASLLRMLSASREWQVVGLLDDDPTRQGRELFGHRVVAGLESVGDVARRTGARDVIIAMPEASGAQRRRAAELCLAAGLRASTLPPLDDLIAQRAGLSDVRRLDLDDLLGRDPVRIDGSTVSAMVTGKTVLITGAGGSIGRELCRQVARLQPKRLVFLEQGEYALYQLVEEFRSELPNIAITPLLGDVKDARRVDQVFASLQPEVIFHAAAYKHVALVEALNESPALNNNAYGTHVVAAAAVRHGADRFVLVSTDKAVQPSNVMGATKRLAEMLCQAHQRTGTTQFTIVRFGNVLGSAGSVVPKFSEQIARGGPVTVTHPDVTRYFMSIPEAVQLVLQSAALGMPGQIFVLEMGEPLKILDLARHMIALQGRRPDEIEIVFTGLGDGEKLHEELVNRSEHADPTPHPKIRVVRATAPDTAWLDRASGELRNHLITGGEARALLARLVPELAGSPAARPQDVTVA
jgi:FlaA1/EpsC-like NDP-sugar epimerase